jgi:hypothetical protein
MYFVVAMAQASFSIRRLSTFAGHRRVCIRARVSFAHFRYGDRFFAGVAPEPRLLMRFPYFRGSFVYNVSMVFVASESVRRFCSSQM